MKVNSIHIEHQTKEGGKLVAIKGNKRNAGKGDK